LALLKSFSRQSYSEARVRPHQVGAAWKNIGLDSGFNNAVDESVGRGRKVMEF